MNPPEVNQLQFFTRTRDIWDAMYQDCENAKKSIFLEQYILERDEVGERFLKLFAQKAAEGLLIRLVIDAVGSGNFDSSEHVKAIIEKEGVVEIFNPKKRFLFGHLFPRDHCKTMLIDDEIAYTGSACMSASMREWRDTQVRFTGSLIDDVKRSIHHIDLGRYTRWKTAFHRRDKTERPFKYVVNRPYLRNPIYKELLDAVKAAKSEIILVTPYLLLPDHLRRMLKLAARRGVKITVMMSEKGDVAFADLVARSYFPALMKRKINLLLYRPTVLHAKYMIVDDTWATVGSTNLDYLSLFRNREGNLIIRDRDAIQTLKEHFAQDCTDAFKVDGEYLRQLPWWYRVLGYLGRMFKRYL